MKYYFLYFFTLGVTVVVKFIFILELVDKIYITKHSNFWFVWWFKPDWRWLIAESFGCDCCSGRPQTWPTLRDCWGIECSWRIDRRPWWWRPNLDDAGCSGREPYEV